MSALVILPNGEFVRPEAVLSIRIAKPGVILDLPDCRFLTLECPPDGARALAADIASLLPAPCSLLPAPCSLLPAPCCSLLPAPSNP